MTEEPDDPGQANGSVHEGYRQFGKPFGEDSHAQHGAPHLAGQAREITSAQVRQWRVGMETCMK